MDLKKHSEGLKEKGIDLEKPGGGGGSNRLQSVGTFLFAPVSFERYQSAGKGTPALMFRMVVMEGEQAGKIIDVDMYLTGQMYDLGTFALCMGHPEEPFDETDDAVIEKLITGYYPTVMGQVKTEEYNGKTSYKVKFWSKAPASKREDGYLDQDEQKEIFNNAVDGWDAYLEWRQKNPRKAPGSSSSSGSSSSNQNYTRSSRSTEASDDDIPF